MGKIRLGIVGTNLASDRMADASLECSEVTVVGVYSRNKESGAAFAEKHGIPAFYTDYYAMLRDIDAVYIASPTYAHCDQAVAAMERGKDVLSEKMMAASYGQALRMRAAAEKNEVTLLEAMTIDFAPSFDAIKTGIARLGRLRRAHLEYCQYSSRYDKFKEGEVLNAFNPELCNSALADIGIYPVHLAARLFGKPDEVRARSVFLENGFEGMGSLILEYPDMLVDVTYSKITESTTPSVIEGEEGSLIIDRVNGTRRVVLALRDGTREEIPFEYGQDGMIYELQAFSDMLHGRRQNTEYLDATLEAICIVNEAYRQTGAIKYMDLNLMK